MSRRSTKISSALEQLGFTSPESKQNGVNDEIKSHPPPLNKREPVEVEVRRKKVLVSLQKQVQEVEECHAKQVEEHINKLEKYVDVDASHKSSCNDNNNNDDDNDDNDDNDDHDGNDNDDEDDDADDNNNDDDTPEAEIANIVNGNKRLTARGVTYKEGKCYQSILCSICVKYFIFVTC